MCDAPPGVPSDGHGRDTARERSARGRYADKGEDDVAKILIVDDDPDIIEAGTLVLGREGFEVVGAPNRSEGMKKVEEEAPDLIILDVMMEEPDDGLRMARDIRRAGSTVPIIMLTSVNAALGLNIDRDEEMVPVDEFLTKPVEPQTLVAKVKGLLGS